MSATRLTVKQRNAIRALRSLHAYGWATAIPITDLCEIIGAGLRTVRSLEARRYVQTDCRDGVTVVRIGELTVHDD